MGSVVTMAICAVIASANTWKEVATFASRRKEWFQRFLELPNGIPSRHTFRRVFDRLDHLLVDDVEGLISLAQIGALEIHAWGSRADKLEQPDRLIFDLDPDPAVAWKRVGLRPDHQKRPVSGICPTA
jgi:DNA primase